jgi:hypothetical protein
LKLFFSEFSNDVINALFQGADNQGGLIEAVGNFESKVAARAALEVLRRLIDLERNKGTLCPKGDIS